MVPERALTLSGAGLISGKFSRRCPRGDVPLVLSSGERHDPAGTGIRWLGRLVFGAYGVIGGVVTFAVGALWGVLGSQLAVDNEEFIYNNCKSW